MSRDISDNDDEISDVSMPEESDDSESEDEVSGDDENGTDSRRQSHTLDHRQMIAVGQNAAVGTRYAIEAGQTNEAATGRVFAAGFGSLPLEVWQHIFTFIEPKTLGSMLRVNKAINFLLDPESPYLEPATSHRRTHLARRQPDEVWQQSRKRFRPRMPSPMDGMTELSMWKLACGLRCASCGKTGLSTASHDQWHCGPGENGVRPIWAFAESACGPCLRSQTVKEIDLLLSASVPSTLICALPFIFVTNDLHVVASTVLQQGQHPPSSLQISKYFLKRDVENIKKEYLKMKGLGDAAAEEWVKGLDNRGKAKRLDSARWERWETAGGLQQIRKDEPDNLQGKVAQQALPSFLPPRPATFHGYSGFGQPPHVGSAYPPPPGVATHANQVTSNFGEKSNHPTHSNMASLIPGIGAGLSQRVDSPLVYGAYGPPGIQKAPRSKEEAERLKLARRAEIERRCKELEPPISPSVLVHMPSFQASLHIIKPLDDTAWDMLKPRILSQRADAEQRENERLASVRVLQQAQTAPTEESIEREWEKTQVIVKNRIGVYSDEIIRDGWGSGSKVTKETAPRFAAEVLMYVRKRFYAEIAKDDAAARIAGHPPLTDPPNGPFTRKLTLENMRWVFDTKIKQHTDKYRKEVFLCNACDAVKWYAFAGVCDHYASKHGGLVSSGSVVVNWRAEWPEEPPFKPEPHLARRPAVPAPGTPTQISNSALAPPPITGHPPPPGISGAQAVGNAPAPSVYTSQISQLGQQPQFSDPYYQPAVSYVAPGPYQSYQPATQMPQYPGPPGSIYGPFYPPPAPEVYSNPSMTVAQPPMQLTQAFLGSTLSESTIMHHRSTPVVVADAQSHIPAPIYRTEAYKAQLQDMALTAKALWSETAGVKDMPGSVRVYVILFHVLQRLRERYTEDPPLSMFVDGIQNAKEMRIVRNVNGLACKICTVENANKPVKPFNPYTVSSKATATSERKLYSLPQLVNHFQSAHSGPGAEADGVDWRIDMVELPDKKKIRSLEHTIGMDDHKFQLLKQALPGTFIPDTPEVGNRDLAPSRDKRELYYVPTRPPKSPSPEADLTRLFNPAMDNYPRLYNRGRPSVAVDSYGGSKNHSAKRKATSPLGGRSGLMPGDNNRYFEANLVEKEEHRDMEQYRPAHAPESYLTRPEYNHHEVDLSRLLANAGHVSKPVQPPAHPEESSRPNSQAATKAAEQFLAGMGGRSWETLLSSQRRPADTPAACASAIEDRDEAPTGPYIDPQAHRQHIPGRIYSRRRSSDTGLSDGRYQGREDDRSDGDYLRDEARFVEYQPAHTQAPSREIRYGQPEVVRYADEGRDSGRPVYVIEEPPRRQQYCAVSPGDQHYIDEPYEQREEYFAFAEEHPQPRQVQYEPEIEYIRVRDPGGDYLVEKPRQRPVYTRYEDSEVGRQPIYEDSSMRPVFEDEHVPVRVSQGSQRARQIVYVDEARSGQIRYEDSELGRYRERQQSVVMRVDESEGPIEYLEQPPPRQQIMYDDDPERRQPLKERNPMNSMPMSKSDPAYYEEYDPSNPAPLPVVPRRVQRHE